MAQLCSFRNKAAFPRGAEDLLEMELLALIRDIDDLVGMIEPLSLLDGRKVCRCIERRAV